MKIKTTNQETQNSRLFIQKQKNELLQLRRHSTLTPREIKLYLEDAELALKYINKCVLDDNICDIDILSRLGIFNDVLSAKNLQISIVNNAIYNKRFEAVDFFISNLKEILNFQDSFGNTPLMQAVKCGNPQMVSLLCEKGADVNIPDAFGVLPLKLAQSMKTAEILMIITPYIDKKRSAETDKDSSSLDDHEDDNARQQSSENSEWEKIDSEDYKSNENCPLPPEATTVQSVKDTPENSSFASRVEADRKKEQSTYLKK